MSRTTWIRRTATALGTAVVALLLQAPVPLGAQGDSLTRIPAPSLEIPLPGRAVIRDSARWATLWHRFAEDGWPPRGMERALSAVDFREHMLIAVSMGSTSGCSNTARYVQAMQRRPDSLVVELGPERGGPRITCMMLIHPVDVVRIPRTDRRIVYRRHREDVPVPGAADWWSTPTMDELERMEERRREIFLTALARDPATSDRLLVAIARHGTWYQETGWGLAQLLLGKEVVRADAEAVFTLARARGVSKEARRLLLERHGAALARDRGTPKAVLAILIDELKFDYAEPDVVHQLVEHPSVQEDRELLRALIHDGRQYREAVREACDVFLTRWPKGMVVLRDTAGRPLEYGPGRCGRHDRSGGPVEIVPARDPLTNPAREPIQKGHPDSIPPRPDVLPSDG